MQSNCSLGSAGGDGGDDVGASDGEYGITATVPSES